MPSVRIFLILIVLTAVIFVMAWWRSSLARHQVAKRTAVWFRLEPKGRHGTPLANLSAAAAGFVSALEPSSKLGVTGGASVIRTGSSDTSIETYLNVWGLREDDATTLAKRLAQTMSADICMLDGIPDVPLSGVWYEAMRGQPRPAEATPGDEANRHADAITATLARSDYPVTTIVTGSPMSRRSQNRLKRVIRYAEQEKGAENQAHSRIASRVLTVSHDSGLARELVVTGAANLPGLRFQLSSRAIRAWSEALWAFAASTFLGGLAYLFAPQDVLVLYGVSGVCFLMGCLLASGVLCPERQAIKYQLARGYLLPPRAKVSRRTKFGEISRLVNPDSDSGAHSLGWKKPLIPMNDTQFASCFAPPNLEAGSGASYGQSRSKPIPDRVLAAGRGASRLGHDVDGDFAWLPASERFNGVLVVGDAGSGKTVGLIDVWMADLVNCNKGRDGHFWLEVKGPGRDKALAAARSVGVEPLVFDLAESSQIRLDFFGGESPLRNAKRLVAAMRYSDPAGYGPDNLPVLEGVLHLAQVCPAGVFKAAGFDARNVMALAGLLTGLGSAERRSKATDAIQTILATDDSPRTLAAAWEDWQFAEERVQKYLSSKSVNRDHPLNSSRNKIKMLLSYRSLWQPKAGQKSVPLERLIAHHRQVILNVAPTSGGDEVDGQAHMMMQSIVMSLFSSEILGLPSREAWYDSGRSTTLYCDELSDIAPMTEESVRLVSNLRDKARQAGLRLVFALQRLSQVDEGLQKVLDGFGCVVYMRQASTIEASGMVALIDPDNPEAWVPTDLMNLPVGGCVVKMRSGEALELPFTMQWPWWEDVTREDVDTLG